MQHKIYHLSTCDTCQKILKRINARERDFSLQDIKTDPLTPAQLDELKMLAGSYEALFSRRSRKYRLWGLHEKALSETDYRDLVLKEYTFLKRPAIIWNNQLFLGSDEKTIDALVQQLNTRDAP